MRPRRPRSGPRAAALRPAAALLAATLLAGLGGLAGAAPVTAADGPTGAPTNGATDGTGSPGGDDPAYDDVVRLVQANIYTKLTVPRFQADVAEVLAQQPDFVTYNEVPFRNDAVIAPEGYDLYRDPTDRFTKATPVAWRSDRWSMVDAGVHMISDWRGKPPGREVEIGRRQANWVTLQGVDGRVLSVVSVHVAPTDPGMPDLLRRSVSRLRLLTDRLAERGPVLVGGDFNVHLGSGRYPRDLLQPAGLVPTFDTLGTRFATGDHRGATIDYVFVRGSEDLLATAHRPVELFSDHDAVVADLTWQADSPATTTLVQNDPAGGTDGRTAVRATLSSAIRAAEPGAVVQLVTRELDSVGVNRALRAAVADGVRVRLVLPDRRTSTVREQRAVRMVTASGVRGSWVRRCASRCLRAWSARDVPPALMMVGDRAGRWQARYDVSRPVTGVLVEHPSSVRVSTGSWALDEGAAMLAALR